ncbi:MAG: hypothetical protein JRN08_03830 [Nitrososphaerota archaeon]|nr:hypothetical protein [Nitrososphaerota archaeon]
MDRRAIVVAAAVVVVIAVGASLELGLLPLTGGGGGTTSSSCSSCSPPVVDVVMPAIGSSGNYTNPDRMINMTAGETRSLEVDVYPTVPLAFTMNFTTVLAPDQAGLSPAHGIGATFDPSNFTVAANVRGVTSMTLAVALTAAKGTYDVVVSAANRSNSTEFWGLYFEISVS